MPYCNARHHARRGVVWVTITVAAMAGQAPAGTLPPIADTALLTGNARLACEAILCLSTPKRSSECSPYLQRYFSITHHQLARTIEARRQFLGRCPASRQDEATRTLVDALAEGAGRCDAASLNATLTTLQGGASQRERQTGNALPAHCTALAAHPYAERSPYRARYVGVPERGGMWVAPQQYAQALASYNARFAAEDARARPRRGSTH